MGKSTYQLDILIGGKTQSSLKSALNDVTGSFGTLGSIASGIAGKISSVFGSIDLVSVVSDAMDVYAGFEQSMANTAAIAQATTSQYEKLSEAAKEAGRTSIYTAQEAADALGYMALAGWDTDTSTAALDSVLRMSSATQADIKTTSDLITDTTSALGISVDDLDMYMDKLIQTNNSANTSAEQLMTALAKSGGAAKTLGVSLDDTITSLGILANNSVKGEMAGTALNSMLVRLAGNSTAIGELKSLNVSIWDDKGEFIGLENALVRMKNAMAGMTDEQKAMSMKNIAGTHYYSQMAYLLDAVEESADGTGTAFAALKDKVANSTGALDTMYDKTTDTVEVARELVKDAIDIGKVDIAEAFAEDYKVTLRWLAEEIPNVTDKVKEFANTHRYEISEAFETARNLIEQFGTAVGNTFTWIVANGPSVVGTITGIVSAVVSFRTAIGVIKAGYSAFTALSTVIAATNPVLLAVLGTVVAVSAAVGLYTSHIAKAKAEEERIKSQSLAEHFGDIRLSLEQIDEVARRITQTDYLDKLSTVTATANNLASMQDSLESTKDKLDQMNWMVSIGMELTEDEQTDYKSQISSYVKNVQSYVTQQQYAVNVAVGVLTEGSLESGNLVDKINSFYAGKQSQLAELGTKLNETVTEAFTDGLLDIDEVKEITELQSQMAQIQSQLAQTDFSTGLDIIARDNNLTDLDVDSAKLVAQSVADEITAGKETLDEAYRLASNSYKSMLAEGNGFTESDYYSAMEANNAGYYTKTGNMLAQALSFESDSLLQSYGSDIEQSRKQITDMINQVFTDSDAVTPGIQIDPEFAWQAGSWDDLFNQIVAEGKTTASSGVAEILEEFEPTYDELKQVRDWFVNAGYEVPEGISDGLRDYEKLAALAGDTNAVYDVIADVISDNPDYEGALDYLKKQGVEIPKELADAIESNKQTTAGAVDSVYSTVVNRVQDKFGKPISVQSALKITFNTTYDALLSGTKTKITGASNTELNKIIDAAIMHNAQGGIYDRPILTTFAEEGPEAAIPINNTPRAKSLLFETADRMGLLDNMAQSTTLGGVARSSIDIPRKNRDALYEEYSKNKDSSNTTTISVNYSPNITVSGNTSQEEIRSAMSLSLEELKDMLREISMENSRVAFG